jgi:methionyl-tRNA formyltransferase
MNIIFFGSSHFAVPSLKALAASGHKILCVVTQPDRKRGRGLHLEGTAVKQASLESRLEIYQPKDINGGQAVQFLKKQDADLFIVMAYGQILSQKILDAPKLMAVNAHASLLPRYRGAAPINWTIINGEKESGVTIIRMVKKMDAGPIILQQAMEIRAQDTALTLEDRLSGLAQDLLMEALNRIEKENLCLVLQDEEKASFAPKLKKGQGLINWKQPAEKIHNLIRGCLGWPGAFTHYKGKFLKIYEAKVIRLSGSDVKRRCGEIINISKDGLVIATHRDDLLIERLQIEGKKVMTASEFIAGHKLRAGEILG